ncbi:MAG: hypothetical protein JW863_12880 [Chitinispirillaceae bacterium]|nr:hypothetical protein [Chitinispirillaceae bacterium]
MSSFRLWANDQLITEAGQPGCTAKTTKAVSRPQIASFISDGDSLLLLLQIANFNFDKGGVTGFDKFGVIELGLSDQMYKQHEQNLFYDFLLSGAFIVMAIYHFALFLFGKREKSLIYLGIICLLILVHLSRQNVLFQIFPSIPWELCSRVINIPVFSLCWVFMLFFHSIYPKDTVRKIGIVFTIGSTVYIILGVAVSQRISFAVYKSFIPFMLLLVLYLCTIMARAAFHNRSSAKYLIVASFFTVLAALNDVLNGLGILNTYYIFTLSGFVFILMCEFGIYEQFILAEKIAKNQREKLVETEKLASLGTLIAGVAHEINNPNNSILLSTQSHADVWKHVTSILDDYAEENGAIRIGGYQWEQLRTEMPESIERIIRNSRRIERIVADLKTYARKEHPHMNELVNINMIVRGSITLLENKLKNSTDAFSVDYEENIPLFKGNFQKLEQVIINLVINACESLPDRSRAVRISTAYDDNVKSITVTVSDEGVGIEPKIVRHIFDPFFTTKHNSGGTGLGLSIAQSIIIAHNGELKITSEPGVGTRVVITIPLMEVAVNGNAN